jgi:hypothetical protein
MKAKRQYPLLTERWAVTAGYVAVVVAAVSYLKIEGYIGRLDIASILAVLGVAVLSAIGSLVFSRAPTLKEKTKMAARTGGWGALIAAALILLAYLAFATVWALMVAWGERSQ